MPSSEHAPYLTYRVNASDRGALLEFMLAALDECGCRIIRHTEASVAPFRISFEMPSGERRGIVAYAFLANQRVTRNRPVDEHRFQVKYGSKDDMLHEVWQDPYGLYTTLFLGINPVQGFFVGADPILHSPTRFFISVEFKDIHVSQILSRGWCAWERDRRSEDERPIEVLVGGTKRSFLRYVLFEREALGEEPGHRQMLAERTESFVVVAEGSRVVGPQPTPQRLHELSEELELSEQEVLDLIQHTRRLKMAVRGWVAEEHLLRRLRIVPGVSEARRLDEEGGTDVSLRFEQGVNLRVECKNVLRGRTKDGFARVDFQRTRASTRDPCSRYYSAADFDVVAACLHAVSGRWEFCYIDPTRLDHHPRCEGRIANNVRVDGRWSEDPIPVLREAAARLAAR